MIGLFSGFSGQYAPHGYCLLWQPELIWLHVVSDALIALAYFSIPIALIHFVRRRGDIEFGGMIWLFALFILACGSTHVMAIWDLWHGDYAVEGLVKAITAIASVPTAILLWRLIPGALAIPSPGQLQTANLALSALVTQRDAALAELRAEVGQRERAEAALVQAQKIDAVGQLTGGIAHDFNNLLQAVAGNLDLVLHRPDDAVAVARWATNAMKGVERGTRLTGQLLAFSRTQRLDRKSVDINRLIDGMADLLGRTLGVTITLVTRLGDEVCPTLADPTQLELAILNLSINARDAMPDGGRLIISTRHVGVEAGRGIEPGDYIEIGVSDSGTGMEPDVAARALEPFFTTKEVGKGTGLGLSMAFGVATQSGGTLEIRTAPGEGTTIAILLPCLAGAAGGEPVGAQVEVTGPRAPRPGIRAVVVDDDDDVRVAVVDTLGLLGYECQAFDQGDDAVAAVETIDPDLLVLDFAMPGLNGAEVARQVRARGRRPRIIFITGYADSAALDEVLDDTVVVLRKPFRAADLARLAFECSGESSPPSDGGA